MNSKSAFASTALIILVLLAVCAISLGTTLYFYSQYQHAQNLIKNPTAIGQKEVGEVTAKVSKLMKLPDEVPTLATVTDVKQLLKEPFFRNAQNGDKLLIYTKARKAILYRPSSNLIIETAPVNIGQPQGRPSPIPTISTVVSPTQTGIRVVTPIPTKAIGR